MTRIASIATYPISVPRPQPVWTAQEESKAWSVILTEVKTDDGLIGYGEIHGAPMPRICEGGGRFAEMIRGRGGGGREGGGRRGVPPAGAARRAHRGHGGDRRHRHRAVGFEGQGSGAAGVAPLGRGEP